jgi:hypothetical protein
MQNVFRSGLDTYYAIAAVVYDIPIEQVDKRLRRVGKTVDLADLYDVQEAKLEKTTGRKGIKAKLKAALPNRYKFIDKLKQEAYVHGMVYTVGGYPIRVPPRKGRQPPPFVNYKIACQEGECVKTAIPLCYNYIKDVRRLPVYREREPYIPFYVHDEMVFAFPVNDESHVEVCNGRRVTVTENLNVPHV